jgi:UDP-N-acetylglucosamine acyltransferase
MVGGHYRVPKDVPPYILAGGAPLTYEGLNIVGLRRRGFSREALDALTQAYQILYFSKLNVSQAAQRIRQELSLTPEIQHLLTFIERSKRGIIIRSNE